MNYLNCLSLPSHYLFTCGILKDVFHCAVIRNDPKLLRSYLEALYKVEPDTAHVDALLGDESTGIRGFTHHAVIDNNLDILDMLCDYSANLELRDSLNDTPLSLAMKMNRFSCIVLLVSKGVKINYLVEEHLSLVHYAAAKDQLGILEAIREAGHDPRYDFCQGFKHVLTPLDVAIQNKSYSASDFLFYNNNAPFTGHQLDLMLSEAIAKKDSVQSDYINTIKSTFK